MSKYKEIGSSGLLQSAGYIQEEFLQELRFPRACKIYKEMSSNDPTVGSVLFLVNQLVKKAEWTVEPAGDKRVDKKAAAFIEECIDDLDKPFSSVISEILSMLIYGFSLHEIVYKVRTNNNSKYNDKKIAWAKIAYRAQHSITGWHFDENTDELVAAEQHCYGHASPFIMPMSKCLLFRPLATDDNPEGKSMLRNAYRPWYFKKKIEEVEGVGIERDLAGLPLLIPPEELDIWDADDPNMVRMKDMALNIVKNIRRDRQEGIVLPFGWELKLLSTGSNRQFDTNAIISRYDVKIAQTLLSDLVTLGSDKVGSYALAAVKKSLLATAIETILDSVAEEFNRKAIPQLLKFNPEFANLVATPKLIHSEVETPDLNEIAMLLKAMGGAGMVLEDYKLQNYIREIASMPKLTEDEFNKLAEEKKKQKQNNSNQNNGYEEVEGDMRGLDGRKTGLPING